MKNLLEAATHIGKGILVTGLVASVGWFWIMTLQATGESAVVETFKEGLRQTGAIAARQDANTTRKSCPELKRVDRSHARLDRSMVMEPPKSPKSPGEWIAIIPTENGAMEIWAAGAEPKVRIADLREKAVAGNFTFWLTALVAGAGTTLVSIQFGRERKRIEERTAALAQAEKEKAYLALVVEKMESGAIICNREGKITWCNQSFERLTGFPFEEIIHRKPGEFLQGEKSCRETIDRIRTAIRDYKPWSGEIQNHKKDKSPYWCRLEIQPLDPKKGHLGFLGIQTDITKEREQTENEQALRKKAEEASEAKSRFVATMSHEIRTPLHGVLGYCELLQGEPLSPQQAEYVQHIQTCGETVTGVISEILDFSKIEAGETEFHPEACEVGALIQSVAGLHQHAAARNGTRMELKGKPEWMETDPTALRQIAGNLISNAVKFTKGGQIRIQWDHDGKTLTLVVEDSGTGIPLGMEEAIFEPFRQGEAGACRRHGGTGLGLAISRRLAGMGKGTLSGTNKNDSPGARFTLRLPAPRTKPKVVEEKAEKREAEGLNALIVEDNRTNARMLARILEKKGHTTETAENGREAVEKTNRTGFDIIFMDLQMPEMDGIQATTLIRGQGNQTPIIALTADAQKETKEKCLAAGMDGFLTKPIRLPALEEALKTNRRKIEES